jgi:hypothetical protein
MKDLIIGLLVFSACEAKAQSKWNTLTLDTVVVKARPIKSFKIVDIPRGERKGKPIRVERDVRYNDSTLRKRIL